MTLYEQWLDKPSSFGNQGKFLTTLFQAYMYADGTNRDKLNLAFPEYFINVN